MYLLDSNALFTAKNDYYRFEVCPGFWQWLKQQSQRGQIASVERIAQEIADGDEDDALKVWIESGDKLTFHQPDSATIEAMKQVTSWVMDQNYNERERAKFFAKADPLLIAHAKAHGCKVITHEKLVPDTSYKVKIPNVCEAMGVDYLNTFELLSRERGSFVLPIVTEEDCF